jgi:hypothetical protein
MTEKRPNYPQLQGILFFVSEHVMISLLSIVSKITLYIPLFIILITLSAIEKN